jgi:predicted nucleic acid-binding protein
VLIVDTGPLYAAAATSDNNHAVCHELLANATGPLMVGELVVTEVAYMLGSRVGPHGEIAFAQSIAAGELIVEPVLDTEWSRIAELTEQYGDLPLGMADASVGEIKSLGREGVAERHHAREIATLDHRHFSVVRPKHVDSFTLLP